MATKRTVVIGIFDDALNARKAIDELRSRGFTDDQIGVAARDEYVKEDLEEGLAKRGDSLAEEGSVAGAVGGAAVGGLWGLGIAAGLLPAIGPVIAGGTLMAMLASAGVGATVGTLAGVLVGWGVPEDEAQAYEGDLKAGRVLIAVRADHRMDEALATLHHCNARSGQVKATVV